MTRGAGSAGWSSTTSRRRSSPHRPTPGPRATSQGGPADASSPQRREQHVDLAQALAKALEDTEVAVGQRDRLLATLDELRQGVVVLDADGIEVFRNPAAERYREARHADAVV